MRKIDEDFVSRWNKYTWGLSTNLVMNVNILAKPTGVHTEIQIDIMTTTQLLNSQSTVRKYINVMYISGVTFH